MYLNSSNNVADEAAKSVSEIIDILANETEWSRKHTDKAKIVDNDEKGLRKEFRATVITTHKSLYCMKEFKK